MFTNKEKGSMGESAAVDYLIEQGYVIMNKNFSTRYGEIDIIAKDSDCIAFIEVKTRKDFSMGLPREAVNVNKQRRIARMALVYIAQKRLVDSNFRFDVIEAVINSDEIKYLRLIKDAFQVDMII